MEFDKIITEQFQNDINIIALIMKLEYINQQIEYFSRLEGKSDSPTVRDLYKSAIKDFLAKKLELKQEIEEKMGIGIEGGKNG